KANAVNEGSPGQRAGPREGVVIGGIGHLQDPDGAEVVQAVQQHAAQTLPSTILRAGTPLTLNITPQRHTMEGGSQAGRIGVMLGADFPMVTVRYGALDSMGRGISRTVDTVWLSLKMMGRMITGDVSLRNVSGPVTI